MRAAAGAAGTGAAAAPSPAALTFAAPGWFAAWDDAAAEVALPTDAAVLPALQLLL